MTNDPSGDSLLDVAAAVADHMPVDWDGLAASAPTLRDRAVLERLRLVAGIASAYASGDAGTTNAPTPLPSPPFEWGPLRVMEHVGRGSFGDVYRAVDSRLDREVALKMLRRRGRGTDASETVVVDEARHMARVRHPNIVTIYGAERIGGRVGMWMEFVHGRTLEEELRDRGPFQPDELINVGIALSGALSAVHDAGLLHRDIKTQNVMRADDGRILLTDFGTGRDFAADDADRAELAGTPLYLAPEVLVGAPATPRSDLYSVGVLLYHLATGGFPVAGRSLSEIRASHASGRTVFAPEWSSAPAPLRATVEQLLSSVPNDRPADAAALGAALSTLRTPASAPSPRRRPAIWGLAAASAILIGVLAIWGGRDASGDAIATTGPGASHGLRMLWSGPDTPYWAAISPDGRLAAYIEDAKGNLALRDLQSGTDRLLTTNADWSPGGTGEYAEQPVFSRDGHRVAYIWLAKRGDDWFWQLRTLDLSGPDGAQPATLYEYRERGWFGPYDWSPDGTRIAVTMRVADGTSRMGWVSVPEKRLQIVAKGDWRMSRLLAWSPDGRYLAYDAAPTEQSATTDVFVSNLDGSRIERVVNGAGNDSVAGWTPQGELLFLNEGRGTKGLWAQPITDGAAIGPPRLLEASVPGDVLAPTFKGALDLSVMNDPQAIYSATVDLSSGRSLGPAVLAVAGISPRNRQPQWSRDGRSIAFMSSAHGRLLSHRILTIHQVDHDQARVLPLKLAQLWTYDWSPDGTSLLARAQSLQGSQGIFRIDAQTGAVTQLLTWTDEVRQFAPQWADDGESFYYTRVGGQIGAFVLRHLVSGRERELLRYRDLRAPGGGPLPNTRDSTISPDRQYVACYTIQPESIIWLIRLSDLSVRELYRVDRRNAFVHNALIWTPDSRGVIVNQDGVDARQLWFVPLDGQARPLDVGPGRVRAEAVAIHPDGSQVAFVAGDPRTFQLVRLENVVPSGTPPR